MLSKTPKKLDTLLIFGDSVGNYFYRSIKKKPICTTLFKKCKVIYSWAYVRFKYFTEAEEKIYDNKDFNETLFLRGISESIILDRDMKSRKSVVVFNFGLHTLKSLILQKAMKLFDKFLTLLKFIKTTFMEEVPQFIWKTTTSPIAPMIPTKKDLRFLSLTVRFLINIAKAIYMLIMTLI